MLEGIVSKTRPPLVVAASDDGASHLLRALLTAEDGLLEAIRGCDDRERCLRLIDALTHLKRAQFVFWDER